MKTYKFARLEPDGLKKYEFDSLESFKLWVDQELEKFKKENRVTDESKDRYFMALKSQFDKVLEQNKDQLMIDYLKCSKCSDSDHEEQFCRCESRNIRIAKEKRSRGEGVWKT